MSYVPIDRGVVGERVGYEILQGVLVRGIDPRSFVTVTGHRVESDAISWICEFSNFKNPIKLRIVDVHSRARDARVVDLGVASDRGKHLGNRCCACTGQFTGRRAVREDRLLCRILRRVWLAQADRELFGHSNDFLVRRVNSNTTVDRAEELRAVI